jgi:ferritin-like metal-binding protein YciE
MAVKTMEEKFTLAISKTYDAEHQFLDGQREMLQHANNPQLKEMLDGHIRTTEQQIGRLEQIFDQLGQKPKRVTCEAASGLIADGRSEIKEVSGNPKLVDIVIADAQAKVEHSEIATYRGLVMGAEAMGQQDALRLLRESLREEEQTAQMVESRTPQLLQEAMQKSREAGA